VILLWLAVEGRRTDGAPTHRTPLCADGKPITDERKQTDEPISRTAAQRFTDNSKTHEGAELSEAPIDPVHHDLVADTLGGARGHIGSPAGRRYLPSMTVRARVIKGRLVVDQPTPLPEGTVLDLVVDDEGTPLTPAERRAINASIDRAWLSAQAGKLRPATALIAKLRQRRAR